MTAILDEWAWSAAGALLTASLQGAVPVGVVWFLCRRVKTIAPSTRALVWWMAALGFVLSLLPLPSLRVPLLPSAAPSATVTAVLDESVSVPSVPSPIPTRLDVEAPNRSVAIAGRPWWVIGVVALWIAGLTMHLVRLGAAYSTLRGIVRRSTSVPEDVLQVATRMADTLRLKRPPPIRVSEEIESPLVAGLVRPIVLLPASVIASLSPRELAMAIGHELAHIRRRDLLFAWVPALAERLFFFHPLARLAVREYAAERESACDDLVLGTMDVAPQEYGRMLVRLGVGGMRPMFTMGGSSPSLSSLKRRLDMLNHAASHRAPRTAIGLVALVAMLAVVPLQLVARTPAPQQNPAPGTAAPAPAKPAPTAKPQPAAPAAPVAPRPAPRPSAQDGAALEQAIAEQRRNMQRMEEALVKLRMQLESLYAQENASRAAAERLQVDSLRKAAEEAAVRERQAGRGSDRELTMQFLENQLRMLTAEHEQTSARLRQLSTEIDSIRQKIDEARRAQELESLGRKVGDQK